MSFYSGTRLKMADVKAQLIAQVSAITFPGITIGTVYDQNYWTLFGQTWPAIWVGAVKVLAADNGDGVTENGRQYVNVQIALRLVLQRNPPSTVTTVDLETRLNALYDATVAALYAWKPANARKPFSILSTVDGPASETSVTVDLIFGTTFVYMRS